MSESTTAKVSSSFMSTLSVLSTPIFAHPKTTACLLAFSLVGAYGHYYKKREWCPFIQWKEWYQNKTK
ncbi:MAG: hypothetical protein Sylvanvirus26_13 [Sylvanvirus sp.]|uniref:Uncharacterized protein n=1 Tax=Sylvanvirus sp. TaxID=2487774 RepID=A0A3G5ALC8_9VIRU|nr:MAG: hypothetical protein Sylvanvirus26_13 [Sylvanvirus sp.]